MANDECYTPKWIFDALGVEFDLDVCAPKNGGLYVPAKRWFSIDEDGLSQNWDGIVWMNPPYSKPTPWIDRFIEHKNGICLVPTSKSYWFSKIWNAADTVTLMPPNLKFHNGMKMMQIQFQTIMFGMGEHAKALYNIKWAKVR